MKLHLNELSFEALQHTNRQIGCQPGPGGSKLRPHKILVYSSPYESLALIETDSRLQQSEMTALISGFMTADYMQMINAGRHAERKGRGWADVGWYHGGGVGPDLCESVPLCPT